MGDVVSDESRKVRITVLIECPRLDVVFDTLVLKGWSDMKQGDVLKSVLEEYKVVPVKKHIGGNGSIVLLTDKVANIPCFEPSSMSVDLYVILQFGDDYRNDPKIVELLEKAERSSE